MHAKCSITFWEAQGTPRMINLVLPTYIQYNLPPLLIMIDHLSWEKENPKFPRTYIHTSIEFKQCAYTICSKKQKRQTPEKETPLASAESRSSDNQKTLHLQQWSPVSKCYSKASRGEWWVLVQLHPSSAWSSSPFPLDPWSLIYFLCIYCRPGTKKRVAVLDHIYEWLMGLERRVGEAPYIYMKRVKVLCNFRRVVGWTCLTNQWWTWGHAWVINVNLEWF